MSRAFTYVVAIEQQSDGSFLVTCPDFPELLTEGSTREGAVEEAGDALEEVVAARIRRGEDLPDPSPTRDDVDSEEILLPAIMAAKAALAMALRRTGMSQVAFARKLGNDEKDVRRLLDPKHASKLTSLQSALRVFNQEVEISIIDGAAHAEISETAPRPARDITALAEGLAGEQFPDEVRSGRAIPVMKLLNGGRLSAVAKSPVDVVTDNGLVEEGALEYSEGRLVLRLRARVAATARDGNGRSRFTVAHEIGHLALHHADLRACAGMAFRDSNCTPSQKLPPGVPVFRSPEWQANTWASAFLMPLDGVRAYLKRVAQRRGEFSLEGFAANFQVSVQAARIRLEKLLPTLIAVGSRAR